MELRQSSEKGNNPEANRIESPIIDSSSILAQRQGNSAGRKMMLVIMAVDVGGRGGGEGDEGGERSVEVM